MDKYIYFYFVLSEEFSNYNELQSHFTRAKSIIRSDQISRNYEIITQKVLLVSLNCFY